MHSTTHIALARAHVGRYLKSPPTPCRQEPPPMPCRRQEPPRNLAFMAWLRTAIFDSDAYKYAPRSSHHLAVFTSYATLSNLHPAIPTSRLSTRRCLPLPSWPRPPFPARRCLFARAAAISVHKLAILAQYVSLSSPCHRQSARAAVCTPHCPLAPLSCRRPAIINHHALPFASLCCPLVRVAVCVSILSSCTRCFPAAALPSSSCMHCHLHSSVVFPYTPLSCRRSAILFLHARPFSFFYMPPFLSSSIGHLH